MENTLGLLRIRVQRGINLAVRDTRSSDPYVVITMGNQVYASLLLMKMISVFVWEILHALFYVVLLYFLFLYPVYML